MSAMMQPDMSDPRIRKQFKQQVRAQLEEVERTLQGRQNLLDAKRKKLEADTNEALAQLAIHEQDVEKLLGAKAIFTQQLEDLSSSILVPRVSN